MSNTAVSTTPRKKVTPRQRYAWLSANCSHDFKAIIQTRRGSEPEAPFLVRMIQAGLDATTFNGKNTKKPKTVIQIPATNSKGGKGS